MISMLWTGSLSLCGYQVVSSFVCTFLLELSSIACSRYSWMCHSDDGGRVFRLSWPHSSFVDAPPPPSRHIDNVVLALSKSTNFVVVVSLLPSVLLLQSPPRRVANDATMSSTMHVVETAQVNRSIRVRVRIIPVAQ